MEGKVKKALFVLGSSARDNADAERSFETEEHSCSEVVQEIGCTEPAFVYRERESASDPDRPELGRLMQAASGGHMDVVIVCDHSGLSKDSSALEKTLGEFERLGVAVLAVEQLPRKGEVSA